MGVSEYWIARLNRAMTTREHRAVGRNAGGPFVFGDSPPPPGWIIVAPAKNRRSTEDRGRTRMAFTEVDYKVADRIATITLNRPEQLNAWTGTMGKEVRQAMEQADKDDNVRVIVLTGAG